MKILLCSTSDHRRGNVALSASFAPSLIFRLRFNIHRLLAELCSLLHWVMPLSTLPISNFPESSDGKDYTALTSYFVTLTATTASFNASHPQVYVTPHSLPTCFHARIQLCISKGLFSVFSISWNCRHSGCYPWSCSLHHVSFVETQTKWRS